MFTERFSFDNIPLIVVPLALLVLALPFITSVWMLYSIYKMNQTTTNLRNLTLGIIFGGIIFVYIVKQNKKEEFFFDHKLIYILITLLFVSLLYKLDKFTNFDICVALIASFISKEYLF